VPPNPSELLLSNRFKDLMADLQTRYDYIFFDCPPIDILPDSAIIAPYCNSTIFVIRARLLDKHLLPEIQNAYNSGKYNNMCILLNDVKYEGKGYYGYHKYGFTTDMFDYGYGYSNVSENKKINIKENSNSGHNGQNQ
ncbi:MAG: chromosome partitioning protein ParA, partial [Rikenellaceae bacterium]